MDPETRGLPQRKRRLWWLLFLLLALAALGGFFLLRPSQAEHQAAGQPATAQVVRRPFRITVSGPGTLAAYQSLDLEAQVKGTVLGPLPQVGERVKKGQLLLQIDPTAYQRAVENAKLALEKAKAELASARASQTASLESQRQAVAEAKTAYVSAKSQYQAAQANLDALQKVFAVGGASRQELEAAQRALDQARTQLESAQSALEVAQKALALKETSMAQDLQSLELGVQQAALALQNAEEDLANTRIVAPFDGVIAKVQVEAGQNVAANQTLLTLLDISSVDLPLEIDETEISKVRVGQKVEVTLDAFPNQIFPGTVTAISPSATLVSSIPVFYVTVSIPNAEGKLRPGMSAEGAIIVQEIQDALIVPRQAVQVVRGRAYVRVRKEDGTLAPVEVELGPEDGVNQVILSGLAEGQAVVVPRQARLSNSQGPAIKRREFPPAPGPGFFPRR